MNARNAVISGRNKNNKKRRKWKQIDNSFPVMKVALRVWIAEKFENPSVLDVYGGYGQMYRQVWQKYAANYCSTEGDALEWLKKKEVLDYDIYDIDPYASPYEAMILVAAKNTKNRIGIVATDGTLRRQALFYNTSFIHKYMCWDSKNKAMQGAIYHQYPNCLKAIINKIFGGEIKNMAVKSGKGFGKNGTSYFAVVIELNKK